MNLIISDLLERWKPLLTGYSASVGLLIAINQIFGPISSAINLSLISVCLIGWTAVVAYFESKPPRNRTEKFGIGVFIEPENDKMRLRLENDLLARLKRTIIEHQLGDNFEVVFARPSQATRQLDFLDSVLATVNACKKKSQPVPEKQWKPWERFQKRTNCGFIVWGRLCERKNAEFGGENAYVLTTDLLVTHSTGNWSIYLRR